MKLRNRIMSWLLSPGAFALWHSMGNPEEWKAKDDDYDWFIHASGIRIWIGLNFAPPLRLLFCRFGFNGEDYNNERRSCIGIFERHLIYGRAVWCAKKVRKRNRHKAWNAANMSLFKKLTVNE